MPGLPDENDDNIYKTVYVVHLFNYCSGIESSNKDKKYHLTYCSPVRTLFSHSHWADAGLIDLTGDKKSGIKDVDEKAEKTQEEALGLGIKAVNAIPRVVMIMYLAAFALTVVQIIFGIVAIFTRWFSFLTAFLAIINTIVLIGVTAMAHIFWGLMVKAINEFDYSKANVGSLSAVMGKQVYGVGWLACALSVVGTVFWVFTICCGSTERGGKTKTKAVGGMFGGGTAYSSVQVDPYTGQQVKHGENVHMGEIEQGYSTDGQRYEAYRHREV